MEGDVRGAAEAKVAEAL